MEEFQTRTSDNMENIRAQFSPYVSQVQDNAQAKITTLNQLLQSQVESIKEGLERTTTDLRSTLEDKMEEVRGWFLPYVSMFTMETL